MQKLHKITLIVSILILIIILLPFIYLEVNRNIYENKVTNYLLEEMEYDKGEIGSVEGVYGFKMPEFYTIVTFENEPYVEYTYFAHNTVLQFGYEIIDKEHDGITKEDLKNLDPNGLID
ncbi:DUF3139 domain-containing protein [Psychrobacillus sp. FSL K6-2684]|uniref:DUF3139 domain-containing protein n=1 Tax=unclassified Psychrobacillus TaxID=2636677 RepID=UPI00177FD8E6|nr:DUF3139 domain-containing protein [Psychrobacillus sp. AK 1817]